MNNKKSIITIITSIVINSLMIFLIFKKIDLISVKHIIVNIPIERLIISGAFLLISSLFLSPFATKLIIDNFGRLSYKEVFILKTGSLGVKFISPYKSGDLSRILYYKNTGMNYSESASTLFFEYYLKFIVPISFAFSSIIYTYSKESAYYSITAFFIFIISITSFFLSKFHLKVTKKKVKSFHFNIISAFLVYSIIYLISISSLFYLMNNSNIRLSLFIIGFSAVSLIEKLPIFITKFGVKEFSLLYVMGNTLNGNILVSAGFVLSLFDTYIPLIISSFFLNRFIKGIKGDEKNV